MSTDSGETGRGEPRWNGPIATPKDEVLARISEEEKLLAALDRQRDMEGSHGSYRDLARELGSSEASIKVAIHRMRRRFGALLREAVAQTLHEPSNADVDDEIRYLFSVLES